MKHAINITLLVCCFLQIFAQQNTTSTLSLDECIRIAVENNLAMKGNELDSKSAKINIKQSKLDQLPTIGLNYNVGVTNGRSIDLFSNDYVNESLQFSFAGLNLDAVIFDGFRLKNTIKQNQLNLAASEMRLQELKDELILNVTISYLQVLNNQDQLKLARSNQVSTEKQMERVQTLFKEEVGNPSEYFDLKGQLAGNRMSVANLESSLVESKINLATILNLDSGKLTDIERIDQVKSISEYGLTSAEVYEEAIRNLALLKTKDLERKVAELGVELAKADAAPRVSFFGRANTNFSSAAQMFNQTGVSEKATGDFVRIDNTEIPVLANQTSFESEKIGYFNQFSNNVNTSFGVSINVPLFDGRRAKNNAALQQIVVGSTTLQIETTKQVLRQSIESAHNSMMNAYHRFVLLNEQIEAYQESYRVNEIRFNNGISNTVDYLISKNNLENAQLNLTNVKYEYQLRVKVLDYYRGV